MKFGLIENEGITRVIPPPLPPYGGGFFYLKRSSDGAILIDGQGDYGRFDSEAEALYAAADHGPGVIVRFMPKLRPN